MAGIVTISMEIELAWGTHDKSRYHHLSDDASAEEEALNFFLDRCEKYNIPVSFDVVGHLLHESCAGQHKGPYSDDWWNDDPGTDYEADPLFYNPGLVESIDTAETAHEICTHTYSHILCEQVSDDLLDHELESVTQLHRKNNLVKPSSVVTPRHQQPNYEILKKNGVRTIRKPFKKYKSPQWVSSIGAIGEFFWILSRQHPTTELERADGVTETYCTPHPSLTAPHLPNGQKDAHPAFQVIPQPIRQKIHTRYIKSAIDRAIQNGEHVHFWTHLFNTSNKIQRPVIEYSLKYLSECQSSGDIAIKKMSELPDSMDEYRFIRDENE